MTKKSTLLLALTVLSLINYGCSEKTENSSKPTVISEEKARDLLKEGNFKQASELYTRIGELLLSSPEGAIQASKMFDKALEADSNNSKANFYSAMVSLPEKFKGFTTRFRNVVDKKDAKKLDRIARDAKREDVAEVISFLTEAPKDKENLKNYEDARVFVRDEIIPSIDESLTKLAKIQEEQLNLELYVAAYTKGEVSYTTNNKYCYSENTGRGYETRCYDYSYNSTSSAGEERLKIKVDQHDLKALKTMLLAYKSTLELATIFKLDDVEKVRKDVAIIKRQQKRITDYQLVKVIKQYPNFLTVDGDISRLGSMFDQAESILNNLMDFSKLSSEFCTKDERKKHLFSNLCVKEETREEIETAHSILLGRKDLVLGHDKDRNEITVEVDVRAILDSKLTSMQALLPRSFAPNGKALTFKDPTFGGVFPNADLIEKLKLINK